MPRLSVPSGPVRRPRRGVTLPELLVAMFLLSVIGASLLRVFSKQQQAYKDLTLSAIAKRELRMGATVLPAELRSISSAGGDIVAMSEQEMEIRAFIGTSVICARGGTGASDITIPPENLAKNVLTTFISRPQVGDFVFLYNDSLLKGAEDDAWTRLQINGIGTSSTACPGAPFTDAALDPPATKHRITYTVDAPLPDSVRVGAVARFARPVKYRIYQETSGNWYLGMQEFLGGGWSAMQPLAGPYRSFAAGDGAQSGLQFRYYDTLGVRVTNLTKTTDVGRVDVFLRTNAGTSAITERKGAALRDSVVMRVAIRNSK